MKKRLLSILMGLSLVTGLLAGCGGSSETKDDAAANASSAQEESAQSTEEQASAEPENYAGFEETPMDLGGRTIRLKVFNTTYWTYAANADDTSNETLALMEALESIEKDYNCVFEISQADKGEDFEAALLTAKAAGETYCDIYEGMPYCHFDAANVYGYNVMMDMNDPQIADIIKLDTNPWGEATNLGYLYGTQYGVNFMRKNNGDIIRSVLCFNKDYVEQYGLEDPYELVRNGEWTFDKFEEMCAEIVAQSDGSVVPLSCGLEEIIVPQFVLANNGSIAELDEATGGYVFTGLSDNTMEALNYLANLSSKGYLSYANANFYNQDSVFYCAIYNEMKYFVQGVNDIGFNVGLLPGPMGPQADDYCTTSYSAAMYHIMEGVEKPEEIAAVLVAMANRLTLVEEEALEYQEMYGIPDEDSIEMFQIMFNNYKYDASRVVSGNELVSVNEAILELEKTPAEAYEEIQPVIQAMYDKAVAGDVTSLEDKFADLNKEFKAIPETDGLIAHFTFDDETTGFTSNGIEAVAVGGSPVLADEGHNGKAIHMDDDEGNYYLTIQDASGNNPLAGKDEFSVIVSVNTKSMTNWAFYMAPDENAPEYLYEKYLAILDFGSSVTVERYNNDGARAETVSLSSDANGWKQYLLVVKENSHTLYSTNGEIVSLEMEDGYKPTDITGGEGVIFVGYAPWGTGEYYHGYLDELAIYDYAFSDDEIKAFSGLTSLE